MDEAIKHNEEVLLKKLEGLVTNLGWKPEDVIDLFSALLTRLSTTNSITQPHTWMLTMLHHVEMNYITPSWTCPTGKTVLQLICDQTVTVESLVEHFGDESEKTLEDILKEIRQQELNQIDEITINEVRKIVSSVEEKFASSGGESQLFGLAKDLFTVCVAVKTTKRYKPRLTQMVSWCLMALSKSGRLLQVGTGEGKSCIVAMFAAFRAMKGEKVDVMSSSTVLAERDMLDWEKFYKALKISVSCNSNKHDSDDLKKCYQSTVVYGTVESFAGDWLRHNFERMNIFGERKYQCAIVDEVDSLMLDKGLHVVYMSTKMPALQHLSPLLALIWATVNQHTDVGSTGEDTVMHAVEVDVRRRLLFTPCGLQQHANICYVPGFLRDLVNAKLTIWVENALQAQTMTVGHEYIIESHGLVPVDYSCTGVVENFVEWSDGLHQFLQMKHGLKLSNMNAVTNYMSNVGLLQMYKDQIYGLSGTLGKETETETLQNIYPGIKTCQIPSFKRRKLFEVEGVIAHDEEEWIKTICNVVTEQINPNDYRNKRAVLVICETINRANALNRALEGKAPNKKLYINNNMDNSSIFKEEIQAGQVIIATNLAGRGTDLQVSHPVKIAGGLFVVQTFLPMNTRVEEQAFGRTARQGFPGCAQLIVCSGHLAEVTQLAFAITSLTAVIPSVCRNIKVKLFVLQYELFQRTQDKEVFKALALTLSGILTKIPDSEMKLAKRIRDDAVAKRLASYLESDIPKRKKEAELFSHYLSIIDQLYKSSNNTPDDSVLSALNETWSMWLLVTFNEKDSAGDLKRSLDADMERAMQKLGRRESPYANLHHYTQFGNDLRKSERLKESVKMYTKAIEADPCWAAMAYYNRAFASLAQQGRCQDRKTIRQALTDLKNAQKSVDFYSEQVEITHTCVTLAWNAQRHDVTCSDLERFNMGMEVKRRGLRLLKNNIDEAVRKLERAQNIGGDVKVEMKLSMFLFPPVDLLFVAVLVCESAPGLLSKDMLKMKEIINHPIYDIVEEIEGFDSLGLTRIYTLDTLFSFSGFFSKIFNQVM